jgi:hypothetical protein
MTFQTLYEESQTQVQDTSSDTLIIIKRAINTGAKIFGAILRREWRNTYKTFSIVANQQFYQMPEDCIRIKTLKVTVDSNTYPLTEIIDDATWDELNITAETSDIPTHYFVRGSDEFGIYPIPSSAITNAGTLKYERRMRDLSAADYTTGTIAVTNNSTTVTGNGTVFTANMVGRSLKINDPDGDGMWYKIADYVGATEIELENTYSGATASGKSYVIGELPDIPEEYHEALIDYAAYRVYVRRKDIVVAKEMRASFEESVSSCKEAYGSKTTSNYYRPVRLTSGYVHVRKNYTVS